MATALIDMPAGAAGDMLLAALLAAGGDRERVLGELAGLGLGPITITADPVLVGGIAATRVEVAVPQAATWQPVPLVDIDLGSGARRPAKTATSAAISATHPQAHRPYRVIRDLLDRAALPDRVHRRAQAVFRLLAEAEGAVHGLPADEVEFHEVGALDAIVDVVGCCLLLEQLGIDRVVAGPLVPGHGTVQCAHGRMPVPVPAVAKLLERTLPLSGIRAPWRALPFETGELTTPTGAALVCGLADEFLDGNAAARSLHTLAVGYGAGHKTIPRIVNVLRVTIAEERQVPSRDEVAELTCQMDDLTGEHLAMLMDDLLANGALDAYAMPALMKKGRPGHVLTVLCRLADEDKLAQLILTRSTTIGLRHAHRLRTVLPRETETVLVDGQAIRLKVVTLPDGSRRAKPEADDVVTVAHATGRSSVVIADEAQLAWRRSLTGR